MDYEPQIPVRKSSADREGAVSAEPKIDYGSRQIWVFGHVQSGIEIPRRDDASASFPEMMFYVVGNQGFVLD
jgi:hypothetical protein